MIRPDRGVSTANDTIGRSLARRWLRRPVVLAIAVQALGSVLALALFVVTPELLRPPILGALVQGGCCAIVSHFLQAPWWWRLIHLVFAPLAALAMMLGVPPSWWLTGFIALLVVFWRTDVSRVPLYLSSLAAARVLESLLPRNPCFVLDAGCGDGRTLRHLARSRPDCEFVGIEHAPLTWLYAKVRAVPLPNLQVRRGDFWKAPFTPYDLVYAFLSPAPMADLWTKAAREMRPGTLLVSNSFEIPGRPPDHIVPTGDSRDSHMLVFRMATDTTEQKHAESVAVSPIRANASPE